jgi:type IV secretion system protein VirB1
MLPGMEMLACPDLAVSPQVMQHIVHVESSANPYAIGVVGGQLERQPRDLPEALATVRMLDAKGYNFSVGLAQVNRANLGRYGLDSYQKAFDACANLSAGAHILADCYASAGNDWGKAFSCYYSGNFTAGFRDGYVQRVYASIKREVGEPEDVTASRPPAIEAMALPKTAETPTRTTDLKPVTVYATGGANYRVSLRSMAIDATAGATVPAIATALDHISSAQSPTSADSMSIRRLDANTPRTGSVATDTGRGSPTPTLTAIGRATIASTGLRDGAVFVPGVRGPNDPQDAPTTAGSVQTMTSAPPSNTGADRADFRQEQRDAAFVF